MKVLPQEFAEEISESTGFRNAIVREYNKIDNEVIFRAIDEAIKQYADYYQYILDFLKTRK